jgi:hypothetical protein
MKLWLSREVDAETQNKNSPPPAQGNPWPKTGWCDTAMLFMDPPLIAFDTSLNN